MLFHRIEIVKYCLNCNTHLHLNAIYLGCKNPGCEVARKIKFYTKAPNICATPVKNLLNVTLFVATILRWLLDFWKFVHPC